MHYALRVFYPLHRGFFIRVTGVVGVSSVHYSLVFLSCGSSGLFMKFIRSITAFLRVRAQLLGKYIRKKQSNRRFDGISQGDCRRTEVSNVRGRSLLLNV